MVGGNGEYQFIFEPVFGQDVAAEGRAFDQSEAKAAGGNILDDVFGVLAEDLEAHGGMAANEGGEEGRQNVLGNGGGSAQSKFASGFSLEPGKLIFRFAG